MQELLLCQKLLREIAANYKKETLTHTQIRVITKVMRPKLIFFFSGDKRLEIEWLLDFLEENKTERNVPINLFFRSMTAQRILEFVDTRLLEKDDDSIDSLF